jgi:hypothetical protein
VQQGGILKNGDFCPFAESLPKGSSIRLKEGKKNRQNHRKRTKDAAKKIAHGENANSQLFCA